MLQLHVVFSTTAVLAVQKLFSWLPYRATPSDAQTSRGVSLISLLYTSKQRAERIMTWREVEIIDVQHLPVGVMAFEAESTLLLRKKKADGGKKGSFFMDQICTGFKSQPCIFY